MTALTSQQMRELADVCFDCEGTLAQCKAARVACCPDCQHYKPRIVALRAAADQLEAVRKALDESIPPFNCELRPDGSEDPVMSAYVDGARDVYMPVNNALNGASDD